MLINKRHEGREDGQCNACTGELPVGMTNGLEERGNDDFTHCQSRSSGAL